MPYFKMVRMGFTCIFQTNTFLVGRYWKFQGNDYRLRPVYTFTIFGYGAATIRHDL